MRNYEKIKTINIKSSKIDAFNLNPYLWIAFIVEYVQYLAYPNV